MQLFNSSSERFFNLSAEISLRAEGSMKVTDSVVLNEQIKTNRDNFLHKLSIKPISVISAELVHGNAVEIVTRENGGQFIPKTDGLITSEKDVYLSVTVADCLPIVIFHPEKEILCLLHAGWRGLESKIIENAFGILHATYAVNTSELLVGIGPAIGSCHYEVSRDVAEKFSQYPDVTLERDSKIFLDLKKIAQKQLMELDILPTNIKTSDICTYCQSDTYFSHRKDKSEPVQAMMVVVGLM